MSVAVAWVMIMKIPWMMVTLGFKSLNAIVRQRSLDRGPPLLCPTSLCLQAVVCWAAAEPISWSRPRLLQAQLRPSQSGQNIADKEPDNELKQPEQTRQISAAADSP